MILIRDVFQAKYGKGNDLVQLFKEAQKEWTDGSPYGNLLLTDLSGSFFTVVTETRADAAFGHVKFAEAVLDPGQFKVAVRDLQPGDLKRKVFVEFAQQALPAVQLFI